MELGIQNVTKVEIDVGPVKTLGFDSYKAIRLRVWNRENLNHNADPVEFLVTLFAEPSATVVVAGNVEMAK